MLSSSGRRQAFKKKTHYRDPLFLHAACMPMKMVTFKNSQTSPDNGQGGKLVSKHERGKRWKGFGNTWKGFQNLSTEQTFHYLEVVTDAVLRRVEGASFILRNFRTSRLIIHCPYRIDRYYNEHGGNQCVSGCQVFNTH
jgi:hypothetical protein